MAVQKDTLLTEFKSTGFGKLEGELNRAGSLMGKLGGLGGLGGAGGLAGLGAAALGGLGAAGFQANSELETVRAQLLTLYRDAGKADQAFRTLRDMDISKAFGLEDVTEAFARMGMAGMNPTEEKLKAMADAASFFKRSMSDVAFALEDARVGELERLKEFGISKSDIEAMNKNIFNAKGQIVDFAAFEEAVFKRMAEKFKGSFENVSKTGTSAFGKLKASLKSVFGEVGSILEPFTSAVLGGLTRMADGVIGFLRNFKIRLAEMWVGSMENLMPMKALLRPLGIDLDERLKTAKEFLRLAKENAKPGAGLPGLGGNKPGAGGGSGGGLGGSLAQALREWIGGGEIARFGIKASEMPGVRARTRSGIKVEITTADGSSVSRAIKDVVARTLDELNRHGAFAPAGA